jgi:hypothetical protein
MTFADDYNLRNPDLVKINDIADAVDALSGTPVVYTPTFSAEGSMTYTSVTIFRSTYAKVGNLLILNFRSSAGTIGGTPSSYINITTPIAITNTFEGAHSAFFLYENGAWKTGTVTTAATGNVRVYKPDASVFTAGDCYFGYTIICPLA